MSRPSRSVWGSPVRRVLALLVVMLAAGCAKPPSTSSDLQPASTTPQELPPPTYAPPTDTPPTPTPDPTPTPTPSAPPPQPTPAPANDTANATPPVRPEFDDARSGWVVPPQADPSTFVTTLAFSVYDGANVTARASLSAVGPEGSVPVDPVVTENLTVLGPDGKLVNGTASTLAVQGDNLTIQVSLAPPLAPGEWTLVYTVQGGASDGSSAGDRYALGIAVRYG